MEPTWCGRSLGYLRREGDACSCFQDDALAWLSEAEASLKLESLQETDRRTSTRQPNAKLVKIHVPPGGRNKKKPIISRYPRSGSRLHSHT